MLLDDITKLILLPFSLRLVLGIISDVRCVANFTLCSLLVEGVQLHNINCKRLKTDYSDAVDFLKELNNSKI